MIIDNLAPTNRSHLIEICAYCATVFADGDSRLAVLGRLIPAAHAASVAAAVCHVVSLIFITQSSGVEDVAIAVMTYLLTLAAAIPFGIVMLTTISLLDLGLALSFVLFLLAAPLAVISVSSFLFGYDPATIPLQYGFVAIPAVLVAWYFSVFHEWKQRRHRKDLP